MVKKVLARLKEQVRSAVASRRTVHVAVGAVLQWARDENPLSREVWCGPMCRRWRAVDGLQPDLEAHWT